MGDQKESNSVKLVIKDDDNNVDITLSGLKTFYPVSSAYKSVQKLSSGRNIPFEAIDNKLYKANSNCTCFITSERRIHAWIKALAEILYIDQSKGDVIWRDHKDESDTHIVHTEIIIYDGKKPESDSEGDISFKVIIYLTTGKVMVQGKKFELFGELYFDKCLQLVKLYTTDSGAAQTVESHTQNNLSQIEAYEDADQTIVKVVDNDVQGGVNESEVYDTQDKRETPSVENIVLDKVDDLINAKLAPLSNRYDVMEKTLVNYSDTLSKLLELQNQYRNDIMSELVQDV